jgi:hypothetical protein
MRKGKELDLQIAKEVMGHSISREKRGTWIEGTPKGTRPLKAYSSDISAAWEVAAKIGVSLIPVEGNGWFALVGEPGGWKSPADFIQYLQTADFAQAGAAVGDDAPLMICIAAMKQIEKQNAQAEAAAVPGFSVQSHDTNAVSQAH